MGRIKNFGRLEVLSQESKNLIAEVIDRHIMSLHKMALELEKRRLS